MSAMLTQELDKLAEARKATALIKDAMKAIIEAAKDEKYKELEAMLVVTSADEEQLDADIRKAALELYDISAELDPRVTVKWFATVNKYDEFTAREWCRQNFTPALVLDKKAFEKAVKDGNVPKDIATPAREARAQIATKLEAAGE